MGDVQYVLRGSPNCEAGRIFADSPFANVTCRALTLLAAWSTSGGEIRSGVRTAVRLCYR